MTRPQQWLTTITVVAMVGVANAAPAQVVGPFGWDYLTEVGRGSGSQDSRTGLGTQQQVAGEDCALGEIYDDGSAENGYSGNAALISQFEVVQLFNPASDSLSYVSACVAFTTLSGSDLDLEIVAYANEGGMPGAEIASLAESIAAIPNGLPGEWYGFDITSMSLDVTEPIFVGVRYNPMAFPSRFTLADESGGTTLHAGFVNFNNPSNWQAAQSVFSGYRAMLIRLGAAGTVPAIPAPALLAALLGLLLATGTHLARRRVMPA